MTLRDAIAELIGNARRAVSGDSGKAIAAIAAIQWGSATVRQIADDAAERAQHAGEQLQQLTDAIEAGEAAIAARIGAGHHDAVIFDYLMSGRFDNAISLLIARGRFDADVMLRDADITREADDAADERAQHASRRTCGSCDMAFNTLEELVAHHEATGNKPHPGFVVDEGSEADRDAVAAAAWRRPVPDVPHEVMIVGKTGAGKAATAARLADDQGDET
jgi:hypothetical protein